MNLGKDIEHGGYPNSESRTIGQMRRDADLYAGIGRKAFGGGRRAGKQDELRLSAAKEVGSGTKKVVDTAAADEVRSLQPHEGATETNTLSGATMILTRKSLSKNGKQAFYAGAANVIRIPLAAFPEGQAPEMIEVADGVFAPAKQPKVKLTKEERAEARKNAPKPTLAELAKRAQERADKLAKKAAEAEAAL